MHKKEKELEREKDVCFIQELRYHNQKERLPKLGVPNPKSVTHTARGEQRARQQSFICISSRSPLLVIPPGLRLPLRELSKCNVLKSSRNHPHPIFHETSPWCQKGWGPMA